MAIKGSFKVAGGNETPEALSSAAGSGADPACREGSRAAPAPLLLPGTGGPSHRLHKPTKAWWTGVARIGPARRREHACGKPW